MQGKSIKAELGQCGSLLNGSRRKLSRLYSASYAVDNVKVELVIHPIFVDYQFLINLHIQFYYHHFFFLFLRSQLFRQRAAFARLLICLANCLGAVSFYEGKVWKVRLLHQTKFAIKKKIKKTPETRRNLLDRSHHLVVSIGKYAK